MKAQKTPQARVAPASGRGGPRQREALARPTWRTLSAAAILIVAALLAYAPALRAGFIWDDDAYVTHSPTVRAADGLWKMWFVPTSTPQYYPLVHTTFWIEYRLHGLHPLGYHLINVLLHATSAVLFWRLLVRLGVPGAWLAAAIFAVHPVEVESVAWVTERKNVLSLALVLGSLLCYLRFAPLEETAEANPPRWRWYVASLALFVAALLAKTVVLSMPAVFLVLCWWKRGRITPRDVTPLVPFFAIGAVLGFTTAWMEKHHVGAAGPEWELTPVERLLLAGQALWFYAGKIVWPYPLAFFYPRFSVDQGVWWQYLYPAAALAVMVGLFVARKRIGRGPLAAVLIFAGVLVPALGFFDVFPFRFSYVADHFQYHASLALIALAAAGAVFAFRGAGILPASSGAARVKGGQGARPPSLAAIGAAATPLVILGMLTFEQAGVYHDLETLYRDTISKNPTGWTAYSNLGVHLDSVGRLDEALAMAQKAIELNPHEASVHANLASVILKLADRSGNPPEKLAEAEACYHEALRLEPDFVQALTGLGMVHLMKHELDAAQSQFEQALTIDSKDPLARPRALCGIGDVMRERKLWTEAEDSYRQALSLDPDNISAHFGLASALRQEGSLGEAIEHLQAAIALDRDYVNAQFELANALAMSGLLQPSAYHHAEVLRVQPAHVGALNNLAVVLLQMGQTDRAIPYLREAVRLRPDYAEARNNLERALAAQAEERRKGR